MISRHLRLTEELKTSIERMELVPNNSWFYPVSELNRQLTTGVNQP